MLGELNKWLGEWQYIWFFVILSAGLLVEAINVWLSHQEVKWAEREFEYDKAKDDKRIRRKTTKKTTKNVDGSVTEEQSEEVVTNNGNESNEKTQV